MTGRPAAEPVRPSPPGSLALPQDLASGDVGGEQPLAARGLGPVVSFGRLGPPRSRR